MTEVERKMIAALAGTVSDVIARAIVRTSLSRTGIDPEHIGLHEGRTLLKEVTMGMGTFVQDPVSRMGCAEAIEKILVGEPKEQKRPERTVVKVECEQDIITARWTGHSICKELGFHPASQLAVATAISELARNIIQYVGAGEVSICPMPSESPSVEIFVEDAGPGISNLDEILAGTYQSKAGMGLGIAGARRLTDEFEISTSPKGTKIRMAKHE